MIASRSYRSLPVKTSRVTHRPRAARWLPLLLLVMVGAPSVSAFADPACGATVTSNVTLTGDLVCPAGYGGYGLIVGADNVTIDGAGHQLFVRSGHGVYSAHRGVTVRNLVVRGDTGGGGVGVSVLGDNATVTGVTLTDLSYGIHVAGAGSVVTGNQLSGCWSYGLWVDGGSGANVSGNTIPCGYALKINDYTGPMIFTGNNLAGSYVALTLTYVSGTTFDSPAEAPNLFGTHGAFPIIGSYLDGVTLRGFAISRSTAGYGISLSGTNVTVDALTISRLGSDLVVAGNGATVTNVTLTDSPYGIRVIGAGPVVTGNRLTGCWSYGVWVDGGSGATVSNNSIPCGYAVKVNDYTGPITFAGNDLTGSYVGLSLTNVSTTTFDSPAGAPNLFGSHGAFPLYGTGLHGVTVRGLTISGSAAGYGIALSGTNITVDSLTVSRLGSDLAIGGSGATVKNVTLTDSPYGIRVTGAGPVVTGNRLTGCWSYGVWIDGGPGATVSNNIVPCGYAIKVTDYAGPITFTGNDVSGSYVGLSLANVTGATFASPVGAPNLFGTHGAFPIYGTGLAGVTLRGFSIAGSTAGYGIALSGANLTLDSLTLSRLGGEVAVSGDGTTVKNVTLADSSYGLHVAGANPLVTGNRVTGCWSYGIWVSGSSGATLSNNVVPCGYALKVTEYTGPLVFAGNDVTGSYAGLTLTNVSNTTVENAGLAHNVFGSHGAVAVNGSNLTGVTVRGFDVSGKNTVNGVSLSGTGITVDSVTARGLAQGIVVSGAGSTVTGCDVSGSLSGLYLSGAGATVTNNLMTACPQYGLTLWSFAGPLVMAGNDLRSSTTAIWAQYSTDFIVDNDVAGQAPNLFGNNVNGFYSNWNYGGNFNITLRNLDVSGNGPGSGVTLAATNGVAQRIVARNRSAGINVSGPGATVLDSDARDGQSCIYVSGTGAQVRRSLASGCSGVGIDVYGAGTTAASNDASRSASGLRVGGSGATITDNVLTEGGYGMSFWSHSGPAVFTGNDLRNSSTGIWIQYTSDLVLDNAVPEATPNRFGNNVNGIYSNWNYAGNFNVTIRNVDVSGSGPGTGVTLASSNGTVQQVIARSRQSGINASGPGIRVLDCDVTGSGIGISLSGLGAEVSRSVATGCSDFALDVAGAGAKVTGNDGRHSGAGLRLGGSDTTVTDNVLTGCGKAMTFWSHAGATVFAGNDLRNSAIGIWIQYTNDLVLDNGVLGLAPNLFGGHTTGIWATPGYGPITNVTLRNFDVSGDGTGVGVSLYGNNLTVENVVARQRDTGIGLSGLYPTVKGCDVSRSVAGLSLSGAREAVVTGNTLQNTTTRGLYLGSYTGSMILAGNDFSGSTTAITLDSVQDLTVDNAVSPPNIFGNHATCLVCGTGQGVTLRNMELTGLGLGTGIALTGQYSTVENVTFRKLGTAVSLTGDHAIVTGALLRNNLTGLWLNGTDNTVHRTKLCWNATAGLANAAGAGVDAADNFWGTAFGPRVTGNPTGTGDVITGNVVYSPFQTQGSGCESDLPVKMLALSGLVAAAAGTAQQVSVRALDRYGALNDGYTGTVHLRSTDPLATLGLDAALVAGVGTFAVTLRTIGSQTVIASDLASPEIFGTTAVAVTAGPAAKLVLVSGDGQSAAAGTALANALRVRVTDIGDNPLPGINVAFVALGTGASIAPTLAQTGADGIAAAAGVVSTVAGPSAFTAAASGLGSVTFTATATAGQATRLVLTGVPATVVAGTAFSFAVRAEDSHGNAATGYGGPVRFSATDLQAVLPAISPLTAGAGAFSATFKTTGARDLSVADTYNPGFGGSRTVLVTAAAASVLTRLSGNGQTALAGANASESLVVGVADAFGNPVPAATVSFAALSGSGSAVQPAVVTSDALGRAATTAKVGTLVMSYDYSASAPGLSGSPVLFQLQSRAGVAARLKYLSGGNQYGLVGQTLSAPLLVLVTDDYGNRVPAARVAFSVVGGGGSVEPAAVLSDGAALASTTATLGPVAGRQTFRAAADFTAETVTFDVTAMPGAPAALVLLSGDGQSAAVGAALPQPLRARVNDAFGNGVSGVSIDFRALTAGASLNPTVSTTDASGAAQSVATLAPTVGPDVFTAAVPGLTGSPLRFQAFGGAGAATRLAITGAPGSAASGTPFTLTVTAYDGAGNLAADATGALRITSSDVAATLPTAASLVAGTVTFSVTLRSSGSQTLSLLRISDGLAAPSLILNVSAGTASALTRVSGDGQSAAVNALLPLPLRVQVTDAQGNGVAGQTVTFAGSGGASTVPATQQTDAQGFAQSIVALGSAAGPFVFTVSAPGLSAAPVVFQATGLPGSGTRLGLSQVPGTVVAGRVFLVTVTARDSSGNVATGLNLPLRITSSDMAAVLPATLALSSGVATFSVTLRTSGQQTLSAVDTGASLTAATVQLLVAADAASAFTLESGDDQSGPVGALLPQPLRVRLTDVQGNGVPGRTVTFTGSSGATAVPASVLSDGDGYAQAIAALGTTAGDFTFTVTVGGLDLPAVLFHATGIPGTGARLVITQVPVSVTAGLAFSVTVTAYDASGNVATGLSTGVRLSSSDPAATVPTEPTLVGGHGTFEVVLRTAGQQMLTAADVGTALLPATVSLPVVAGSAYALAPVSGDRQSGAPATILPQPLRVRVTDRLGNAVSGCTVAFAAAGGGSVLPATTQTDAQGLAQSFATLGHSAGTETFSANAADLVGSPVTFTAVVTGGQVTRFLVAGLPFTTDAGATAQVQVRALDIAGNTVADYAGTVVFASTDARAEVPAPTVLNAGMGTFPVTLRTAGPQVVGVSDALDSSLAGAQTVLVRAGPAARVTFAPATAGAPAGQNALLGLRLEDALGNLVPLRAAVELAVGGGARFVAADLAGASGLGGATLRGTTGADGRATVLLTDLVAETVSVTATATGLAGGAGTVSFSSAGPDHFALTSRGATTVQACACVTMDLRLLDVYGNPVQVALPDVRLTTSGAARIGETSLLGIPEGALPALSVSGSPQADGTASFTVCDERAEDAVVLVTQPQLPGRGVSQTLRFTVGPFSAERSELTSDVSVLQAGAGVARLSVTPRDRCANLLGPEHQVVFSLEGPGVVGLVEYRGDGSYGATLAAPACTVPEGAPLVVHVAVDGVALAAVLSLPVVCVPVSTARTEISVSRTKVLYCEDRSKDSVTVRVVPRDENGVLLGADASVALALPGMVGGAMSRDASGAFTGTVSVEACSPEPRPLTVRVNGVELTRSENQLTFACAPVDPGQSRVVVEPSSLVADGVDRAQVSVYAVTACAEPARARVVSLQVSLGQLAVTTGTTDDTGTFTTWLSSSVAGTASIGAVVEGISLAPAELTFERPSTAAPTGVLRVSGSGCQGAGAAPVGPPAWIAVLAVALLLARRRRHGR